MDDTLNKLQLRRAVAANLAQPLDLATEVAGQWTQAAVELDQQLAEYLNDTLLDLVEPLLQWLERRKPPGWRQAVQELEQLADWPYTPRPTLLVSIQERRDHVTALRDFLRRSYATFLH